MPSWQDLESSRRERPVDAPDDYSEAAAAALSSAAGRRLLDVLDTVYMQAVLSPNAPESALRELNAKRHLVRELRLKMELGLAAARKAADAVRSTSKHNGS